MIVLISYKCDYRDIDRPGRHRVQSGVRTMNSEQQRLEILRYYIGGKVYDPDHSRDLIRELKNLDYLRCGITSDIEETLMTTDYGILYLDISGVEVIAPTVKDGRLVDTVTEASV